jgi:NAD-dependent dihydropyrimidine dehydrogenase PreA subunit
MEMRYIRNGGSLALDADKCTGCGACLEVCPHAVFEMAEGKSRIRDRSLCMECGACMRNCAAGAVRVRAGVGCATAIINAKLRGAPAECSCGGGKKGKSAPTCCG